MYGVLDIPSGDCESPLEKTFLNEANMRRCA